MESKTVATVKHGERLEIVQRHRKFMRVRTRAGAEGWVSESQLLSAGDMANLNELSERAAKMPSQGIASSFGDLNVHTQPNAHAPSFVLIKAGEKFTVLGHLIAPRTDLQRAALIPPTPKKVIQKPPKDTRYPALVVPKPPGPPPDWLALSKTDVPADEGEADEKPVPTDNWSLVRTASGQSGWVLTRRLIMAIPDEVAQYAEGHRIVSYFPLGYITDGDQKKEIWLWTTMSHSGEPYDFDSFRVFIWSLRRHRYETAYIDRSMKGYSPVLLKQVEYGAPARGRIEIAAGKYPGFSICEESSDGQRIRREFALLGNVVRFAGQRACEPAQPLEVAQSSTPEASRPAAAAAAPTGTFSRRIKEKVKAIKRRLFGG